MTDDEIDPRIQGFRDALASEDNDRIVVERFLFHGRCHAIDETAHFTIKQRIAAHFSINVSTDLFVVGSSKLGFSIAPKKRWNPFGDSSDIDVAIVSHDLFSRVWHEVHDYHHSGAYWPDHKRFKHYLMQGWIRPDLLPSSPSFAFVVEWWDFFRQLKSEEIAGPYKIAAALYHDMDFLTKYQVGAVSACRKTEGEENEN